MQLNKLTGNLSHSVLSFISKFVSLFTMERITDPIVPHSSVLRQEKQTKALKAEKTNARGQLFPLEHDMVSHFTSRRSEAVLELKVVLPFLLG